MRIAIIGTHSTGKSKLVNKIYSKLKNQKDVTIIHEVARICPFGLNKDTTFEAQLWILLEHLRQETEKSGHKFVISDRSLIDNYMYMIRAFPEKSKILLDTVIESSKYYDYIFKTIQKNVKIKEDGFRDTDPEFRNDIDNLLKNFMDEHNITYIKLPLENAEEFIMEKISNDKTSD